MKKHEATRELPEFFNPAPEVLIERYAPNGLIPAMIWGKIWRYTKMKDSVCKASVIRMSGELRITPKTFSKYLKKLVEDGFIVDLNPDVEFSTHHYICTEKIHDETEKWLAEKKLKDAKLPWVDQEEIEMIPAGKEVIPGGNSFLPRGDDVPHEQGPITDKDSINIASNKVKNIKGEVGERKNISPTSLAGISRQDSTESNFCDYLPAIEAEGDTDGTSRSNRNGEVIDIIHGAKEERTHGLKTKEHESVNQHIILRKFGLTEFPTFNEKLLFIQLENRIDDNELEDMILRSYSDASSLEEALSNLHKRAGKFRRKKVKL